MRKLKIFGIALAIVVAAAAVLAKDQLNRNVILLKDGRVIPVDRVWESGADLFYENRKEIHFVRQADIESIGRQNLGLVLQAGTVKAAGYARGCLEGVRPLFRPGADGRYNWTPWLVLGSMAAPALLFFTLRFVRGRPKAPAAPRAPESPRGPQEMPGRTDVVRFFLQLYRQQVGADPEAAVEFGQLPGVSTGPNTVYELRVRHGADWVRRRMAIGPLGEDSGSRSTCFYVIFDRHLVVKIPPKPVTQLEDYLAGIRKEGHIVERLAPKECIVPKVSVILSEIHQLSPGAETPPDQLEEKYITWLRKNPQHQECLKIKGTFVFFMDLSRYYFLSHILEGLHDLSAPIRAEIAATPELIRYPARFKERYGSANDAVGFDIRDLYHQAEAEAGRVLRSGGGTAAVNPHHIQRWFLSYLETRDIGDAGAELPDAIQGRAQRGLRPALRKTRGRGRGLPRRDPGLRAQAGARAEPGVDLGRGRPPARAHGLAVGTQGGHARPQAGQPPGGRRPPELPRLPALAGGLRARVHRRRNGRLLRGRRERQRQAAAAGGHPLLRHPVPPLPQHRARPPASATPRASCTSRTGSRSW